MRPMEFDRWVADLPKYFPADGEIVMSHVLTVLSSTFPEGERSFVRSVAAVRNQLTDPELLADVDGFIGQAEMHGREHQVLNDRLAEYGYPTRGIDRYVHGLYWVRERIQSNTVNLAFTAALEHYTATLAELLLTDEEARKAVGRPGARDMLTWYALEESEHKAVAFDVYKAMGGGEVMRIVVMFLTDLLFIFETSIMASSRSSWTVTSGVTRGGSSVASPGCLGHPSSRSGPFAFSRSTTDSASAPTTRDTKQLIAEWRQALFGRDDQLTELLAS